MNIETLIAEWEGDFLMRRLSPSTVTFYTSDGRRFLEWLTAGGETKIGVASVEAALAGVTRWCLQRFLTTLSQRYNAQTVRRIAAAVHRLCNFCRRSGWLLTDPFAGIELPKLVRTVYCPLTPAHLAELHRQLSDNHFPMPSRDPLILQLMQLGVRAGELARLTTSQFNAGSGSFRVPRIDNSWYLLTLSPSVQCLLDSYLKERALVVERWQPRHNNLFIGRRAEPLTDRQMRRRLTETAWSAGIKLNVRQLYLLAGDQRPRRVVRVTATA